MFPALEKTPCDSTGLVVSVQAAVDCRFASVGAGRLTVGGLVAFFVGSGPLYVTNTPRRLSVWSIDASTLSCQVSIGVRVPSASGQMRAVKRRMPFIRSAPTMKLSDHPIVPRSVA